jgi:hypothetical protein
LARPAQLQLRQLQPDDRGVRQSLRAAVLGKQRQRLRPIGLLVQHLDRPTPRKFLRVVDLAEVKNVLLIRRVARKQYQSLARSRGGENRRGNRESANFG